jgi:hypothetical protein
MDSIREELLRKKKVGGGGEQNTATPGGVNVEGLVNFVTALRGGGGKLSVCCGEHMCVWTNCLSGNTFFGQLCIF